MPISHAEWRQAIEECVPIPPVGIDLAAWHWSGQGRTRHSALIKAALRKAVARGKKLGRPRNPRPVGKLELVSRLSHTEAAIALCVSRSTIKRWRRAE